MSVQKNKKITKIGSQSFLKLRKMFNTTAVITLLLPNLVSVGLVAAQELPAEEPAVEEVEEATDEADTVDTVEEETEEVDSAPEAPVEEPVEVAPETPVEEPGTTNAETSELGEPTEVLTLINVRAPQNMENYINTLQDFQNHPLILTNQVTGEVFKTSIRSSDGNTSNHFQLETTVHAYERGNQPSGKYTITLPQELIDLGYGLTRDHSVQSNFGIVGMTNLSYNAPQSTENIGEIARNVSAYDYLTGRDIGITLTTLNGQRTYTLGSRNLALPSGEYNIRITNSPTDTRPQLLIRESSLVHAPEREVELTRDGNAYVGTATLDFTNSTRPQIFKLNPMPLEITNTVTIDPNGGTIDDGFVTTEVDEGEMYTLPYIFQSGLQRPGYTLTGYSVEGTLLDAAGNAATEIPAPGRNYTPMSDVTLTANWEVTSGKFIVLLYDDAPGTQRDRYTLTLVAEDGTELNLTSNSYGPGHRTWEVANVPNGTYTLIIDGYNMSDFERFGQSNQGTFTINEDGTATAELVFSDNTPSTFTRYRIYGEPIPKTNTVTIDPNGGTIDDNFRTSEVEVGEMYTVPYAFQSKLNRQGYTLTGYAVEGTLLDANGNPVTQISHYTGNYTPTTDVTLTANWEVTRGTFIIQDTIPNYIVDTRTFALTDGENTYPLTSRSYTSSYREWRVENIPNGTYTLLVDGIPYPKEWNFTKVGHPDTTSDVEIKDGVPTFDLTFKDDSTTTFIRYRLSMNAYEIGVEVRDLDNRRTTDVDILVKNDNGTVFEGTFDQYNLWATTKAVPVGNYTITLTTPEGTVAEINDTVASQTAVATDEDNVFTLEVTTENKGNLSRVFGAFRLVEVVPEPETDSDYYEPIFVDEIILNLNRGNGKLKNPKTLLENMNHMPGGIKVDYTNLNQLDLSGKTTEAQNVEITITYRDGSTDVVQVPLRVIPK